jgi:hypothetical protein
VTLFLRKEWEAKQRRHAVLQDALNARLRLTTHSIDFEIRRWDSNSPPSTGQVVKWIEDVFEELQTDPSALPVDRFGRQEKVYSTRTVDIVFRFLPLSPTYIVDENARVVLGGAAIGGFINSYSFWRAPAPIRSLSCSPPLPCRPSSMDRCGDCGTCELASWKSAQTFRESIRDWLSFCNRSLLGVEGPAGHE